jgi:hypothetical protein
MGGYQLDMEVVAVNEIDAKIFIYQRSPVSDGSVDYADFFYSIASVADLYSVPPDSPSAEEGFYRTDSVSLVFSSMEELNSSLLNIKSTISELCTANDVFLKLSEPQLIAYPTRASNVYFGIVSEANSQPTDAELIAMDSRAPYPLPLSYALRNVPQGSHVCVALPSVIENVLVSINDSQPAINTLTRSFVGPTGLVQDYNIFVTQQSFSGSLSIVVSTTSVA